MVNCNRSIVPTPIITNNYRTNEVLDALGTIFFNKCYLCEKRLGSPSLFEVDHFIPQAEDENLIYEWTNLYLCCKECNGSRKKTTPIGGYMNPCSTNDDVEGEIVYRLPPYAFNEPSFSPQLMNTEKKVVNTIAQLKRCHYGTNKTKMKCASLREIIAKNATRLLALIIEEQKARKEKDWQKLAEKSQQVDNMLSVDAPFTMLMRDVASRYR